MSEKELFDKHFPEAICTRNGMLWEVTSGGLILGSSYVSEGHAWNSARKHVRCTIDWGAGTYRAGSLTNG